MSKNGRRDVDNSESGDEPEVSPKKRRGLLAPDEPLEGESTRVRIERPPYDPAQGRGIIVASWVGTAVFTASALLGMFWLSTAIICVVVSLVLFLVGTVVFIAAFLKAANRSRYEAIGMGGLYFLAGSTAPARVQTLLLGSLGVQTGVAFLAAGVRMYTGLAFGVLVPMFGLGMAGLWGARYGRFGERPPDPVRPTRTSGKKASDTKAAETKSSGTNSSGTRASGAKGSGKKGGSSKAAAKGSRSAAQTPIKKPPRVR